MAQSAMLASALILLMFASALILLTCGILYVHKDRIAKIFDINAKLSRTMSLGLSLLPFLVCALLYVSTSYMRHRDNPQDKIVPTVPQIIDGFGRTIFEPDRNGEEECDALREKAHTNCGEPNPHRTSVANCAIYEIRYSLCVGPHRRLVMDTLASGRRFLISIGLLFVSVLLGLHMGLLPYCEVLWLRFLTFFDKIPALALLPILFIVFGLGETAKIALIVIGVAPTIVLDTYLRAKSLPREQIVKAQTLGASGFEIVYWVVLPQIFPKVLDTICLNLKSVVLFLIAGESLAASAGLGYRIFVVQRYLAMDIIIPYVMWMSMLMFVTVFLFQFVNKRRYPWVDKE